MAGCSDKPTIDAVTKPRKYFNTSGICIPKRHYILERRALLLKGVELAEEKRYFSIWAPRQTGKSTYFTLLCGELKELGYIAIWTSVEDYEQSYTRERVIERLFEDTRRELEKFGEVFKDQPRDYSDFFKYLGQLGRKVIFVIDEVERFPGAHLNEFLHAIRMAYHRRDEHNLKSVVVVGVSNILGIIQDNASPFNITDNLNVPYFDSEEVDELLSQHERETGQHFAESVKENIFKTTAGQPGLVNGFASRLVELNSNGQAIVEEDYRAVEDWYLHEAIDKNIENIKNKAKRHRGLLERLLFQEREQIFNIHKEPIKFIHSHPISTEMATTTSWPHAAKTA